MNFDTFSVLYLNNIDSLQVIYYIFYLVMTQLIASKITKKLNIDKSQARFAWLPIYGTFVLSKLTLKSYKFAIWQLIAFIALFITASVFYVTLALVIMGADITFLSSNFGIIGITVIILSLLYIISTYKIYRGVAKVFNYGVFITILSLFLPPIVWIVFLISKDDNKYI